MQTLLVVGASLSGLSAARAARAQGFAGRLVIVGDEVHPPYDRPPLSKDFLAGRISEADLALAEADDDLAAEWILGVKAVGFDPQSMAVALSDGRLLTTDGLILATGASARVLPEVDGCTNVFTLRTLDDARALRSRMQPGRKPLLRPGQLAWTSPWWNAPPLRFPERWAPKWERQWQASTPPVASRCCAVPPSGASVPPAAESAT